MPGQWHSLASYVRLVSLSEKERDWAMRSHSSYYGYSFIQRVPLLRSLLPAPTSATRGFQRA